MTALLLPYPPSINHYYGRKRGGNLFVQQAGVVFRMATAVAARKICPQGMKSPRMTGRIKVRIDLFPPDRRRRDLDNVLKCLLDALMYAGCYEDDSQIDDLRVVRCGVVKDGAVSVVMEGL